MQQFFRISPNLDLQQEDTCCEPTEVVSGPPRGATDCTLRTTLLEELGELSEHVEAISSSSVLSHGIYILAGEIDNEPNELGNDKCNGEK